MYCTSSDFISQSVRGKRRLGDATAVGGKPQDKPRQSLVHVQPKHNCLIADVGEVIIPLLQFVPVVVSWREIVSHGGRVSEQKGVSHCTLSQVFGQTKNKTNV